MAKMKIDFDGFDELLERFEEMEKDLKPAVEKALKETHRIMTPGIKSAIAPHHLTGDTEESLHESPHVEWEGFVGAINIGFDISKGGLPSIFLMYGTRVHGTPRVRPDMKLWNAVYGDAITKRVEEVQRRILEEELSL